MQAVDFAEVWACYNASTADDASSEGLTMQVLPAASSDRNWPDGKVEVRNGESAPCACLLAMGRSMRFIRAALVGKNNATNGWRGANVEVSPMY